ncbi:MAG: AmmeMemoRadiSam system radical SAM enzyme [Desulfobulbaceae bacterium]|nr:AmmeMemoRadiSam system radical SAM enzyme [Desulfobulbaceae bacterium]HIJ91724.1 AmmeMemoRadiSam system radical SAM enzyme [Deltaproteobacteria bacterium]
MHEALFYSQPADKPGHVRCQLCRHNCLIAEGHRGICKVRENRDGTLYSLNYGRLISENIDPIEKKPIFHLLPGSRSYSIATVGCNFHCKHCQNYEISQYPRRHGQSGDFPGALRTPEQVVDAAQRSGCQSISYTYVEPTIFYEFALDTARLARAAGLKNIFVSNGYTGPEATRELAPCLDANNIDLKSFTDKFYKEVCGAKLQPVLDTIRLMKELGVWVEVTTLVIPGWNDSDEELRDIALFIKSISPDIPWHVSRFWPTYIMTDRPPTPHQTLFRAREIGLTEGLRYVYVGNIPGDTGENTLCPTCGKTVIERTGFTVNRQRMTNGNCDHCQTPIAGIF